MRIQASLFDMVDPYVEMGNPDCIVHLAWRDGFKHNSAAHMEDLPLHVEFVRKLSNSPLRRLAIMGACTKLDTMRAASGPAPHAIRRVCTV